MLRELAAGLRRLAAKDLTRQPEDRTDDTLHRDAWLTCLMSLAKPGDSEEWGTQIFRVTGDQEAPYTQTDYPALAGGSDAASTGVV